MKPQYRKKLSSRFWQKVTKTAECWLWTGYKNKRGYGEIVVCRKMAQATHVSWLLTYGETINAPICALHRCDTPACVNPEHLFLGTRSENSLDRDRKSRSRGPKGESNAQATLTVDDVIFIRTFGNMCNKNELATEFGVSLRHINQILARRRWKHV